MWPKTEQQAEIQGIAKKIAKHISVTAIAHDVAASFPFEHFDFLEDLGYLKAAVPIEYGGLGLGLTDITLAQYEIGVGDGSTALAVGMHHVSVGVESLIKKWPTELREPIFREVVTDGALLNNINSEPEMGSPRGGGRPITALTPNGPGQWTLNGRKTWSTLAPRLTYAVTLAAIEDGTGAVARVAQRMDASGVSVEETWDSMAMRATGSHDIVFTDVSVSDKDFISRTNPKDKVVDAIDGAAWFPLLLSAANLGVARAASNYAIDFAKTRQPTGAPAPISKFPSVREKVARMVSTGHLARNLLLTSAENWEQNPAKRRELANEIAMTKLHSINSAMEITDLAIQIVGAVALDRNRPLERYFRDVRSGLYNPPIEARALEQIAASELDT